jgi:hypothetical protein
MTANGMQCSFKGEQKNVLAEPRVLVHTCNPSTWEAEAGKSGVPGQPGLQNNTLSQETKTETKEETL